MRVVWKNVVGCKFAQSKLLCQSSNHMITDSEFNIRTLTQDQPRGRQLGQLSQVDHMGLALEFVFEP